MEAPHTVTRQAICTAKLSRGAQVLAAAIVVYCKNAELAGCTKGVRHKIQGPPLAWMQRRECPIFCV
jgi:hypothetical protein